MKSLGALLGRLGAVLIFVLLGFSLPVWAAETPAAFVSPWAREELAKAYEAGLVAPNFDLGGDY
ncbi:MAG: hypothetical protein RR731_04975, partial [Oscillospiraceae bacterium]